jgi:hypothetical protein
MDSNKKAQSLFLALSVSLAMPAYAEFYEKPEGVKFYGGVSAGGFVLDVDDGGSADGGSLGLLAGFEEGKWSFEGKLFKLRASEDVEEKTSDLLLSYSMVHRMPVLTDNYVKFKLGFFRYEENDARSTEPVAGIGYGWKLAGPNRLEIEYEYTPQEVDTRLGEIEFAIHMITLQYIYGGSTPRFDY